MKKLLFTFFLIPVMVYTQQPISLDECIYLAWKQNPSFRNSTIGVKEAQMDYVASIGNFLPRISVSAQADKNWGRSIDPNTNGYTTETFDEGTVGMDMTLSLFEGFLRINRVRFEKLKWEYSQWELKDRQNNLAYQVIDSYYKLLLEEQMLALTREQNILSEHYLKQIETFVELGLKSSSDLQEVRARREGDLYRCRVRENSYQLQILQLKQLLNMPKGDMLTVQDTLMYDTLPSFPVPQSESLYLHSLEVMPFYKMIELQQKVAHKQYAIAGGKFSPVIFARFSLSSYYIDGVSTKQLNNNLGKYVGIGVSMPLLSGLERLTTLRKQKLNIYRWQNEQEQAKQQLYTEVEQTVLSLHAGCREHQQALLQMNAEKQVLRESERKWREGLVSVFQLMEARNRFIAAKAELVRVRLQLEMNIKMEKYYRTGCFIETEYTQ